MIEGPIFTSAEPDNALLQFHWGTPAVPAGKGGGKGGRGPSAASGPAPKAGLRATVARWRADGSGPSVQDVLVGGCARALLSSGSGGSGGDGQYILETLAGAAVIDGKTLAARSFVLLRACREVSGQAHEHEVWLCGTHARALCDLVGGPSAAAAGRGGGPNPSRRVWRVDVGLSEPLNAGEGFRSGAGATRWCIADGPTVLALGPTAASGGSGAPPRASLTVWDRIPTRGSCGGVAGGRGNGRPASWRSRIVEVPPDAAAAAENARENDGAVGPCPALTVLHAYGFGGDDGVSDDGEDDGLGCNEAELSDSDEDCGGFGGFGGGGGRLWLLVRVGDRVMDLVVQGGALRLVPSGHLPEPVGAGSTSSVGFGVGADLGGVGRSGAMACAVLDGSPRALHVASAAPPPSSFPSDGGGRSSGGDHGRDRGGSVGATAGLGSLRSWVRPATNTAHPLLGQPRWRGQRGLLLRGGAVLGSWPLGAGLAPKELLSVASDDSAGVLALRLGTAAPGPRGGDDGGDGGSGGGGGGDVVLVVPRHGGGAPAPLACGGGSSGGVCGGGGRWCDDVAPWPRPPWDAAGQCRLPVSLRVEGVGACFKGRFFLNGREQLWLLPPTGGGGGSSGGGVDAPLVLRSAARRGAVLDGDRLWCRGSWATLAAPSSSSQSLSPSSPQLSLSSRAALPLTVSLLGPPPPARCNAAAPTAAAEINHSSSSSSSSSSSLAAASAAEGPMAAISTALLEQLRSLAAEAQRDAAVLRHAELLQRHAASLLGHPASAPPSEPVLAPLSCTSAFMSSSTFSSSSSHQPSSVQGKDGGGADELPDVRAFRDGLVPLFPAARGRTNGRRAPVGSRRDATTANGGGDGQVNGGRGGGCGSGGGGAPLGSLPDRHHRRPQRQRWSVAVRGLDAHWSLTGDRALHLSVHGVVLGAGRGEGHGASHGGGHRGAGHGATEAPATTVRGRPALRGLSLALDLGPAAAAATTSGEVPVRARAEALHVCAHLVGSAAGCALVACIFHGTVHAVHHKLLC